MASGAKPPAAMVLVADARFEADDETITVCAPAFAKSTAISRPMPRLAPVMTTTLPWNSPGITHSLFLVGLTDAVSRRRRLFVRHHVLQRADFRHMHLERIAGLE